MKTYYVNIVRAQDKEGNYINIVALFTESNWSGEGNFCGWYGSEYYNDTTVIAHYKNNQNDYLVNYEPVTGITECDFHFDEIKISSCYHEKIIEAESNKEAVEKFKTFAYEHRTDLNKIGYEY